MAKLLSIDPFVSGSNSLPGKLSLRGASVASSQKCLCERTVLPLLQLMAFILDLIDNSFFISTVLSRFSHSSACIAPPVFSYLIWRHL